MDKEVIDNRASVRKQEGGDTGGGEERWGWQGGWGESRRLMSIFHEEELSQSSITSCIQQVIISCQGTRVQDTNLDHTSPGGKEIGKKKIIKNEQKEPVGDKK